MDYISCNDASSKFGVSVRRIQQMCKNGEIKNAIKVKRLWMIPENVQLEEKHKKRLSCLYDKKPLPIGISDFKLATSDYYYVDKTLMIKDIIDKKPQVSLFTRPRRFGKTLNMNMLKVFFEKSDYDTAKYFEDKLIWKCGEKYTSYQGQYPVIYLSFKDIKDDNWDDIYIKLCQLIVDEFLRHNELSNSPSLTIQEIETYNNYANGEFNKNDIEISLKLLSRYLYKHYKKRCVIIIDEYDTPIEQGYIYGFYDMCIMFMRNFFSAAFKDNQCIEFGFMTGILRVAKESIFSGLNNVVINSVLNNDYSSYFGFTNDDVKAMLSYYDVDDKFDEVCSWYDGYHFGNTEIFNPWSVISYISTDCSPQAFWQATGSNDIIREIIATATPNTIENLHKLLVGERLTTYIDTNVIYPEIISNPYSIYSFLLVAGYLTVDKIYPQFDGNFMCDISIPNKEIKYVYDKEILSKSGKTNTAIELQYAILEKDISRIQKILENFMLESVSYYDGTNEGFYHGMMLGLCAIVSNKYKVISNLESGEGRFDIELYPLEKNLSGFLFEFKKSNNTADLEKDACRALEQIQNKQYDYQMKSNGIANIVKIGIAFCGKHAIVKSE